MTDVIFLWNYFRFQIRSFVIPVHHSYLLHANISNPLFSQTEFANFKSTMVPPTPPQMPPGPMPPVFMPHPQFPAQRPPYNPGLPPQGPMMQYGYVAHMPHGGMPPPGGMPGGSPHLGPGFPQYRYPGPNFTG